MRQWWLSSGAPRKDLLMLLALWWLICMYMYVYVLICMYKWTYSTQMWANQESMKGRSKVSDLACTSEEAVLRGSRAGSLRSKDSAVAILRSTEPSLRNLWAQWHLRAWLLWWQPDKPKRASEMIASSSEDVILHRKESYSLQSEEITFIVAAISEHYSPTLYIIHALLVFKVATVTYIAKAPSSRFLFGRVR